MKKFALVLVLLLPRLAGPLQAQQAPVLDTTTFVVLGEGLAAGMTSNGLSAPMQDKSFPAQMARQMKTAFPQPLIQPPGVGQTLGYPALPGAVPTYPQTRVRLFPPQANTADEAPTLFVFNLSLPNLRLADSLSLRPVPPLIQDDMQQTTINMILGFPSLVLNRDVPLWTQLEYARAMMPTMALVELGYYDVLAAAVAGDPGLIPDPAAFRSDYTGVVSGLRSLYAEVVVSTIPDPIDTAYFISPANAAAEMRASVADILGSYGLSPNDFITRDGLYSISLQFILGQTAPLPAGSVLRAPVAADISARVAALNAVIKNVALANRAVTYDLNGLFRRVRTLGIRVGSKTVTSKPFGGFYSRDGVYPGATGHALIANEILTLLNTTYKTSFPLLDPVAISQDDPVAQSAPLP